MKTRRVLDARIETYVAMKLFGRVPQLSEIRSMVHSWSHQELGVRVMMAMVGIRETGYNDGPLVRAIQETIGNAQKESWCMSTMQTKEAFIEKWKACTSSVYPSENCQETYEKSPNKIAPTEEARPNDLMIWQNYDGLKPLSTGHTECVKMRTDSSIPCIGGNTNPTSGVNGDGDEVCETLRSRKGYGSKKVRGFIRPVYTTL